MAMLSAGLEIPMLHREFKYYESHKKELNEQYIGKFLGIIGEQVVGVFETELEAYEKLKKDYGAGKFLIQQSIPDSNHIQRYHSRVAFS